MPPPAPDLYSELANGGELEMLAMGHDRWKPYAAATLITLFFSGTSLLSAAAFDSGLNPIVFTVYPPPSSSRGSELLHSQSRDWQWCSFMHLVAFHVALSCTSATLVSAATNSIPVVTFLSILFRLERVEVEEHPGDGQGRRNSALRRWSSGDSLLRRPGLWLPDPPPRSEGGIRLDPGSVELAFQEGPGEGLLHLARGQCVLGSVAHLLRAGFEGVLALKITLMAIECFFAAIQAFGFAAAAVPEPAPAPARWKLRLDSGLVAGLVAIVYSGMFVSAASLYLQGYCVEKKGPVFPTLFYPLAMIFTMLVSFFLPAKTVNLGSVIGGVLMAGGLYSVLWGKGKEGGADHGGEGKIEGEECADVDAAAAAIATTTTNDQLRRRRRHRFN